MPSQGYDPVRAGETRKRLIDANNKQFTYLASLKGMTLKEYMNEWNRKLRTVEICKYEKGMQKAIKYEDYEQAALIRDFIKHLKKGNSSWRPNREGIRNHAWHSFSKHIKDFYRY